MAHNLPTVDLALAPEHLAALYQASASAEARLSALFAPAIRRHVTFGGAAVRAWGS